MIVITEMTATGHVYVRQATSADVARSRFTFQPGTLAALGCVGLGPHPIIHCTKDGSSCESYDTTQTFLCPECGRVCCYCAGADDEEPDWCADCWAKKYGKTLEKC